MKFRQYAAVLLAAVMTVTTCAPMSSVTALAAENVSAEETESVVAAENASEGETEDMVAAESATDDVAAAENASEGATEDIMTEVSLPVTEPLITEEEAAPVTDPLTTEEEAAPAAEPIPIEEETVTAEPGQAPAEAIDTGYKTATAIGLNESRTVTIKTAGGEAYFKFVPETEGDYTIYSYDNGDLDPVGTLYDSSLNEIDASDDYAESGGDEDDEEVIDEGSGEESGEETGEEAGFGSNFRLSSHLYAGKTYYVAAGLIEGTGSYKIFLRTGSYEDHGDTKLSVDYVTDSSIIADAGEKVTLTVRAKSSNPIRYNWYKGSTLVKANGASSYTLTMQGNATYRCEVTDGVDTISLTFKLTQIKQNHLVVYPKGNEPDENYTIIEVEAGRTAPITLTAIVEADDKSQLTYKWTNNDGPVAGTTASIEVVPGKSDCYTCEVSDQYGNSKSAEFNIEIVNDLLVYPMGDKDQETVKVETAVGADLTLYVEVAGDDVSQLTYDWYDSGRRKVNTENSPEYTFTVEKATRFTCVVSDQYGNECEGIFNIVINNNNFKAYPEGVAYSESGMIKEITADLGSSVTLSVIVEATNKTGITYKWMDKDRNVLPDASSTSSKYTFQATRAADYLCEARDKYGNKREMTFAVRINNNLKAFVNSAKTQTTGTAKARIGESARLACYVSAIDTSNLTYQWREAGTDKVLFEGSAYDYPVQKSARITCTVTDPYGGTAAITYNVTVDNALTAYPEGAETLSSGKKADNIKRTAAIGDSVTLKTIADAIDKTALTYKWYKGSAEAAGDSDVLTVTVDNSVQYRCVVTDQYGNTATAKFNISVDNKLAVRPEVPAGAQYSESANKATIDAAPGEYATVRVSATALNTDGLKYTWKYHELANTSDADYSSGWTTASASGTEYRFLLDADMRVKCTVKDRYGNTATATFDVISTATRPIDGAEVTLEEAERVYNGSAFEPAVSVRLGDLTLTRGRHFKVTYIDNVNAGTATAKIEGIGKFSGVITRTFEIGKAEQTIALSPAGTVTVPVGKTVKITVTGARSALSRGVGTAATAQVTDTATSGDTTVYTIKGLKTATTRFTVKAAEDTNYKEAIAYVSIKVLPAATAKLTAANQIKGIKLTWAKVAGATKYFIYRGGTKVKTITSGSTVTWTDTAAGTNGGKYTYKVVAYGITGTSTLSKSLVTYRLARPAISSASNSASRKITLKWGRNTKASGYVIQLSQKSGFSGAKTAKLAGSASTAKGFGSLTKGKTYYVRVRSYKTVSGKTYYSAWSASRKVKVAK